MQRKLHPFMRQISITYRCAMRFREDQLADTGLAGCHTPYLTALYRQPGISQEEMSRQLNVNKSTVARQLAILEKNGYVRREPSATDKRLMLVFPTDKALDIKERLFRCYHDWSSYLTQDFTDEEQQQLSRLMARIAQRAEDYVKRGDGTCEPLENT
nr:MarR family transcriptional regulator [Clostridia bacterium]